MNLLILTIKCVLKSVKARNISAILPRKLLTYMKNIQVRTQLLTFVKLLLQAYIDYNLSPLPPITCYCVIQAQTGVYQVYLVLR